MDYCREQHEETESDDGGVTIELFDVDFRIIKTLEKETNHFDKKFDKKAHAISRMLKKLDKDIKRARKRFKL